MDIIIALAKILGGVVSIYGGGKMLDGNNSKSSK